jgi:hypothetical protein
MLGIFVQKQDPSRRITIAAADSAAIDSSLATVLFMCFPDTPRAKWRRASAAEVLAPARRKIKGRSGNAVLEPEGEVQDD